MIDSTPKTITIQLSKGYSAVIDQCDADLTQFKWTASVGRNTVYAYRVAQLNGKRKRYDLHAVILERILGRELSAADTPDHCNLNGLDNRRQNLRLATRSQNGANTSLSSRNTSGYKGVAWIKAKNLWQSSIHVDGKTLYLGVYETAEDAGIAYNHAAFQRSGEFARVNEIPNWRERKPERYVFRGKSGIPGVIYIEERKKWRAYVTVNGKTCHVGYFESIEEAIKGRLKYLEG